MTRYIVTMTTEQLNLTARILADHLAAEGSARPAGDTRILLRLYINQTLPQNLLAPKGSHEFTRIKRLKNQGLVSVAAVNRGGHNNEVSITAKGRTVFEEEAESLAVRAEALRKELKRS